MRILVVMKLYTVISGNFGQNRETLDTHFPITNLKILHFYKMNILKMNETNLLAAELSLSNIPRFKYLRVQSFPPCPKLPASTV